MFLTETWLRARGDNTRWLRPDPFHVQWSATRPVRTLQLSTWLLRRPWRLQRALLQPLNPTTSRVMDLLTTFSLTQTVSRPTHDKGHILDWLLHTSDDHLVQSTSLSHSIASDYACVICYLNIAVPPDIRTSWREMSAPSTALPWNLA